jgi:arginine-tRNA-protein transferase
MEYRYLAEVSAVEQDDLLRRGIRHFGHVYFQPRCPGCSRCLSLRVPVRSFRPSRSQRRVLARNRDLEIEVGAPAVDAERLELHGRFHRERQAARGWRPADRGPEEYFDAFVAGPVKVLELRYRLCGRLVALAYVDEAATALSSIYGMWEPSEARRGLGTFDVLSEIELACRLGKEHLYLGYCVQGCPSLEYKQSFRPCEVLRGEAWEPWDPAIERAGP